MGTGHKLQQLRFGMPVELEKVTECGHPYAMTSAYAPDPEEFSFTLRGAAGQCHMLDQIWFDSARCHCQVGSWMPAISMSWVAS